MRKFTVLFLLLISFTFFAKGQSVVLSKSFIKTSASAVNSPSALDTILVSYAGFTNSPKAVTIAPFELSIDGINFNDTISLSGSASGMPLYIRTQSNQADQIFRSQISFLNGNFILSKKAYLLGSTVNTNQNLSMCTWNIKWFGSASDCNCDTSLSSQNVIEILKELEADVVALQEVVSIPQLQKVVQEMGPQFTFVVADYGSQIPNSSASGYAATQKLAYIYNQQKLTKLNSFGLLRSTYPSAQGNSSPYYYFASGRWPFALQLRVNSSNEDFNFFNLHAKAFSGSTEHNRRAGGALKMVDSINALWPNKNNIILGDYNDLLEGAITQGFTQSPYAYALNNGFVGITLPSIFPGESSYLGSVTSLIDNYMFSQTAYPSYLPNSTLILREADLAIDNFKSTTSDHLPVWSHIKLNQATSIDFSAKKSLATLIQPNGSELSIQLAEAFNQKVELSVFSLLGQKVFTKKYSNVQVIHETINQLKPGIYIVALRADQVVEFKKWQVN